MRKTRRIAVRALAVVGLAGAMAITGSCTLNPATGERQLTLIGEQQEIAMGRQYDESVQAELGLYPDEELQEYIQELGARIAAKTERPNLPWSFRVVDDPTVNAFALPGGFIYVTRGILAHFNSEAELVSVLGHEIGHVTARHSVEQLSRAQLAQLGLGVAMIASEEFRQYAGVAQFGLQMLFLKFGRDDESQADDLGMRYLLRSGHAPGEMPKVFDMLDRQVELHGGQRLPEWQSTHPAPERRAERMAEAVAALPPEQRQGLVRRDEYLALLDGMVFGANPLEGYTIGNAFYHPEMKFRVDFPEGWKIANQRQYVGAASPNQDAVVVLTLAEGKDPKRAAEVFFQEGGVERGGQWRQGFHDFRTTPQTDPQTGQTRYVEGIVGFVGHEGRVFRLLSYAKPERWKQVRRTARASITSFKPLTEKRYLDVKPKRIDVVELDRAMTLAQFDKRFPSTVELAELAVLNGVEEGVTIPAGAKLKRVRGGKLPKR